MEIEEKLRILKYLDTGGLIANIQQYENELQKALTEQAEFKAQNHQFLGSGDCQAVKTLEAELMAQAPELDNAGKKLTIDKRNTWLLRQRTENKELSEAIAKQHRVSFLLSDYEIRLEILKRRLTGALAILALKTAQINFLTGS